MFRPRLLCFIFYGSCNLWLGINNYLNERDKLFTYNFLYVIMCWPCYHEEIYNNEIFQNRCYRLCSWPLHVSASWVPRGWCHMTSMTWRRMVHLCGFAENITRNSRQWTNVGCQAADDDWRQNTRERCERVWQAEYLARISGTTKSATTKIVITTPSMRRVIKLNLSHVVTTVQL